MNLSFFIAKRYLVSKKSHNAINIISGISIAGISIGTMALIIVLSAFNGLSELVQSLNNSFDADIEITHKHGKTFKLDSLKIESIKKLKHVSYFTEVIEGNALLKFNERQCIATIKGVGDNFVKMSNFDSLISDGQFNINNNNVVIGKGISYILQNGPDDIYTPISIYAPKRGNVSIFEAEDGLNELKVYPTGAFSISDEFDYKYVIMNINNARKLLDYNSEVTSVEISIKNYDDIEKIQKQISTIAGSDFNVKNRQEQNSVLYKTLKSEKLWTFIILVFILIIATFNVIGSITMLIIEKKKDLRILHHMGADVQLIRKIFITEGLLITIIGAVFGLLLGTIVCWLQIKFSLIRFTEGYVVEAYPIKFQLTDFIMILGVVLVIGFFATWYPVKILTKKYLIN